MKMRSRNIQIRVNINTKRTIDSCSFRAVDEMHSRSSLICPFHSVRYQNINYDWNELKNVSLGHVFGILIILSKF